MDEHEWTTYDEPDQFQRCAVKPQLRIGQLGGISNEVPNFKIFTRILPKALIPAACFPKLSIAYAECAFGLESKLTLLNPVCQYGALIACGPPHGAGDCRKSG
mgnify:CR=1 FL=1